MDRLGIRNDGAHDGAAIGAVQPVAVAVRLAVDGLRAGRDQGRRVLGHGLAAALADPAAACRKWIAVLQLARGHRPLDRRGGSGDADLGRRGQARIPRRDHVRRAGVRRPRCGRRLRGAGHESAQRAGHADGGVGRSAVPSRSLTGCGAIPTDRAARSNLDCTLGAVPGANARTGFAVRTDSRKQSAQASRAA